MIAFALHGGAGSKPGHDYSRECQHMYELCEQARKRLKACEPGLEVVVDTLKALEDSGLYIAGKGASANTAGVYELDASLMIGKTRQCGSVSALVGFKNPIEVARGVMEKTPHVHLTGDGARLFGLEFAYETLEDPEAYFTQAGLFETNYLPDNDHSSAPIVSAPLASGTVGCVCLDMNGDLVAGTSTAGVFRKRAGRVGDSPLIGCGTWADERVAVSCTGLGEYFIRAQAAARIGFLVEMGKDLKASADQVLAEIIGLGGEGGLISLNHKGEIYMPYRTTGLKCAGFSDDAPTISTAF